MPFPELLSLLKRFAPNSAPIELGLKNLSFNTINIPDARYLYDNGYFGTLAALGAGYPAWSGEPVNLETALSHATVWGCVHAIANPVGFLPTLLMQETGGRKRKATEHPLYKVLKHAPSAKTSAQSFKETLTADCLLQGNGFAKIIRRSGNERTAIGLAQLKPSQVNITSDRAGNLVYEIKNENGTVGATYTVREGEAQDILHIRALGDDGVRGYSVLQKGRNSIGNALAADRNLGELYAKGARVPSHVEWEQYYASDQQRKLFMDDLRAIQADPHKTYLLERGQKLVKDGMSMVEAQGIENRLAIISEICRWFAVPPHRVQHLDKATFNNIEHLDLEFTKQSLMPWLTRWEDEIWRCVLTPREQEQNYFIKFNLNALLRGDFKTRVEGYSSLEQNGTASINEIRDLEDWDPIEGGDAHHMQANMATILPDGTLKMPQPPAGVAAPA